MQDEAKALALCQQKVKQKKLPMEVVDAEYQWSVGRRHFLFRGTNADLPVLFSRSRRDRRKLVFYFVASTRIDFRELVRELFRHFKTRIWMACLGGVQPGGGPDQGQQGPVPSNGPGPSG